MTLPTLTTFLLSVILMLANLGLVNAAASNELTVGHKRLQALLTGYPETAQFPLLTRPMHQKPTDAHYHDRLLRHLFCVNHHNRTEGFAGVANMDDLCKEHTKTVKDHQLIVMMAEVSPDDHQNTLFPKVKESKTAFSFHDMWKTATLVFKSIHQDSPEAMANHVYEQVESCKKTFWLPTGKGKWIQTSVSGLKLKPTTTLYVKHLNALRDRIKSPADLLPENFHEFIDPTYLNDDLSFIIDSEIGDNVPGISLHADVLGVDRLKALQALVKSGKCLDVLDESREMQKAFVNVLTDSQQNAFRNFDVIDNEYVNYGKACIDIVDKCIIDTKVKPVEPAIVADPSVPEPLPSVPPPPTPVVPVVVPKESGTMTVKTAFKSRTLKMASLVLLFGGVILVLAAVAYYLLVDNDITSMLD